MSYGRHPFYIVHHGDGVDFHDVRPHPEGQHPATARVNDDMLDAWLYVMLLGPRRAELIDRLRNGRRFWPQAPSEDWLTRALVGPDGPFEGRGADA